MSSPKAIPTTRAGVRRAIELWYRRRGRKPDESLDDEWLAALSDDLCAYAIDVYGALVFESGIVGAHIDPEEGNADMDRDHVYDATVDMAVAEVHSPEFWR